MNTYPAYKDVGIEWLGKIPSHWELIRLKFLGKIRYGLGQPPKEMENGLPIVRATNIERGKIVAKGMLYVDPSDVPAERNPYLQENEILIVRSGAYTADSAIVSKEYAGAIAGYDMVITPTTINAKLLSYSLLSHYLLKNQLYLERMRAAQPHLNAEELGETFVICPPPQEQQVIADFLECKTAQIDTLIEKKQHQIDLLQEQSTALINHSVTKGLNPDVPMKDSGVEWLGEIPSHWKVVRVKHLADNMISGPFGSSLTKEMYTTEGYRVYGQEQVIPADFSIGDYYISKEKYDEMERYAVSTGDVLISCVGTFGKIAVVPEGIEPGIINPRLIKVCPNRKAILPEYLGEVLSSKVTFDQLEEVNRGGTMGVINLGLLSDILIPVPPIDEQLKIKSFIDKTKANTNKSHQNITQMLKLLAEYQTALISEAVTGKIDVREWRKAIHE